MTLSFVKMQGAGNDFLVLDNRDGGCAGLDAAAIRRLCARRTGVGADGLLLLERDPECDFAMRYYNRDGGEVAMCANGARCMARFAYERGIAGQEMAFRTGAGVQRASILGEGAGLRVRVRLTEPRSLREHLQIEVEGKRFEAGSIDTGVPHLVVQVKAVEGVAVDALGRALRWHPLFHPGGTNVDFIAPEAAGGIRIRTYERGVEEETLACGTGCAAGALLAATWGWADSPVRLWTEGGEELEVRFSRTADGFAGVSLEGPARTAFRGEVDLEDL